MSHPLTNFHGNLFSSFVESCWQTNAKIWLPLGGGNYRCIGILYLFICGCMFLWPKEKTLRNTISTNFEASFAYLSYMSSPDNTEWIKPNQSWNNYFTPSIIINYQTNTHKRNSPGKLCTFLFADNFFISISWIVPIKDSNLSLFFLTFL